MVDLRSPMRRLAWLCATLVCCGGSSAPSTAPAPAAGLGHGAPRSGASNPGAAPAPATYGVQLDAPRTLALGERRTIIARVLPDAHGTLGEVELQLTSDPPSRLAIDPPGRARHLPDGSREVRVAVTAHELGPARLVGWVVPDVCTTGGDGPQCSRAAATALHAEITVDPRPGGAAVTATESGIGAQQSASGNSSRDVSSSTGATRVARVPAGTQSSLSAVRVPFASYLNAMHNRIHPRFADEFVASLSSAPASIPLSAITTLEIVVLPQRGEIEAVGVVRSSGVTAFDAGAVAAVMRAAPFGKAPDSIVSADGRVYVHWELHRDPSEVCSTRNARPFLLAGPR
jgi:TonB family protein